MGWYWKPAKLDSTISMVCKVNGRRLVSYVGSSGVSCYHLLGVHWMIFSRQR